MPTVTKLSDVFSGWCQSIDVNDESYIKDCMDVYGFKFRCVVSKDIPPRHSTFSWIRGLGVTKFDEIFQGDCRLPDSWLLAFPERHISVPEQSQLIKALVHLNNEQGRPMKSLDILTMCPMIISDCLSKCVSVIGFIDGEVTYEQDYM